MDGIREDSLTPRPPSPSVERNYPISECRVKQSTWTAVHRSRNCPRRRPQDCGADHRAHEGSAKTSPADAHPEDQCLPERPPLPGVGRPPERDTPQSGSTGSGCSQSLASPAQGHPSAYIHVHPTDWGLGVQELILTSPVVRTRRLERLENSAYPIIEATKGPAFREAMRKSRPVSRD